MNPKDRMPGYVAHIANAILGGGWPCYVVGGAVRGAVLGLPASDYDICGPATVEQIERAVQGDSSIACSRVYGRMGTMRLTAPEGYVEYTTFRTERYDGGHTPVEVSFVGTAAQDALRRDFTCNALYLDMEDGKIADPTGGLEDIARGMLRATTADPSVIMRDDGVRVLRMVRFAAQLRFAIDEKTYACADAALLRDIAAERNQSELSLILLSDARYDLPCGREALLAALRQMEDLGVWEVLAPGIIMDHAACADAPPDLTLRLAALLRRNAPERAREWLAAMRYAGNVRKEAERLIADLGGGEDDAYSLLRRGYAHAEGLAALRPAWRPLLEELRARNAPDSIAALPVSGDDVARVLGEHSPAVGKALTMLWKHALMHPRDNTYDGLIKRLREWMEERA